VGVTAFNAAADVGDSVSAFAQGLGGGLVDMATGAVVGTAELSIGISFRPGAAPRG
jgi:hypothetical protein